MSITDEELNIVSNSTNPDIEIAGIPTRKDILAAVCLSIPENNAEVKVTPDLDTPGKIARDWEKPNKTISFSLMSAKNFFLLPKISETEISKVQNKFYMISFEENNNSINIFFDKNSFNILGWQTEDLYQNLAVTYIFNLQKNKKID